MGQKTSQASFSKVFKPITTKLDDDITSNLKLRSIKRRALKKGEVLILKMRFQNLGELFDETVLPQQEKQLVPKPPTYEESLEDILAGNKEIYVDPPYFPQEPQDMPPEYDDDEDIDCALDDEDMDNEILNYYLKLQNYDSVEKVLNQPETTQQKNRKYLNKIINDAKTRRNQLKGYKTAITKQFKSGSISETARQLENKKIDNARVTLNAYINHYENKVKTKGFRMRRKKGGNVIFYKDPKHFSKNWN